MKLLDIEKKRLSILLTPFLGMIVAIILLSVVFCNKKTKYENLGLGEYTTALQTTKNNQRITCMDLEDSESCLNDIVNDNSSDVAVWLGNSQLHGIVDYKYGDQNAPSILWNYLKIKKIRIVSFSPPNGNMLEHSMIFKYVQVKIPVKYLIVSAVFDDFRENNIRSTIMSKWEEQQNQRMQPDRKSKTTFSLISLLSMPIKDKVENWLELWMTKQFDIWKNRSEARGAFFFSLYKFRNNIFGIDSQTKRRKINSSYAANMSSLKDMLDLAHKQHIKVLVYIAPLREGVNAPYVMREYEEFKSDIKALTKEMQAYYVNLESLVPSEFWNNCKGESNEIDFMHFKAEGHSLLAKAVNNQFKMRMFRIN